MNPILTITFKNVGHGGTIILEWEDDLEEMGVGIIDCNLISGSSNPGIEHIIEYAYKEVEFMILSHPHTDHFSGFDSLLDYCRENRIAIRRFWHTAAYDHRFLAELIQEKVTVKRFAESFVNRKSDKKALRKLFEKIDLFHQMGIIKKAGIANDTSMMKLSKKLTVEFRSPSTYDEPKKYCSDVFRLSSERELNLKRNNPAANLLSSAILVKADKWNVLLTSDLTQFTIKRLYRLDDDLMVNRLAAIQIPHHGSIHSLSPDFWQSIKGKGDIPVFVSAGG